VTYLPSLYSPGQTVNILGRTDKMLSIVQSRILDGMSLTDSPKDCTHTELLWSSERELQQPALCGSWDGPLEKRFLSLQ